MQSGLNIDEGDVKGKPVVMAHGFEDANMPLEWSHQSRDFLLRYGVDVDYHNFHLEHTVTAELLAVVRTWLERQL